MEFSLDYDSKLVMFNISNGEHKIDSLPARGDGPWWEMAGSC